MPIGTEVTTIHGNRLRRFENGWSPLEGAHWDRWTVYTDAELVANFVLTGTELELCICGHGWVDHDGWVYCRGDEAHCMCRNFDTNPEPDELFDPEPWK